MKPFTLFAALIMINAMGFAQKGCEFNIIGTWQLASDSHSNPSYLLHFTPDGIVSALSSDGPEGWRIKTKSRYRLDNPKSPKTLRFTPAKRSDGKANVVYRITQFDDSSFTQAVTGTADDELTRWIRADSNRYFIVFAAGKGRPEVGEAAFAMLIKTDGHQSHIDSFGLYPVKKGSESVLLGPVPNEVLKEFAREPIDDSVAMLRLEVTSGPYERALRVLQTWERRARENTLLYSYPYLNNAVYLDEVALSLNRCAQIIKMYELTWRIDDPINQRRDLPQVPYHNIMKLRQLNQSLHVRDDKFYAQWQALNSFP